MKLKQAMRASIWEAKRRRSSNSHSKVAKKLSHRALSYASPTEPIEGRTPASLQRLPKASEVYWLPWTPFCLSSSDSRLIDLLLALLDEYEYLARDVAFETADRLQLGMALADALGPVRLSASIGPQPDDGDDVQRAVSGSIAAPVQPMTSGFPRRGGHGADPAQRREAGFRAQPLRIVPGCEGQLCGADMSDGVARHQVGRQLIDNGGDHCIQVGNFVVQLEIAAGPGRLAGARNRLPPPQSGLGG